jgi:hypothetical protein
VHEFTRRVRTSEQPGLGEGINSGTGSGTGTGTGTGTAAVTITVEGFKAENGQQLNSTGEFTPPPAISQYASVVNCALSTINHQASPSFYYYRITAVYDSKA